jgi:coproporphyrinogen III oxidase
MNRLTESQKDKFFNMLVDVQKELSSAFERIDGTAKCVQTSWSRGVDMGGGTMSVIRGPVVEKAGVNVSRVFGKEYPAIEGEHKGLPFTAQGVSTITHMYNPYAPIGHMNVRMLEVGDTFWVGGGADMTPFKIFEDDNRDFHHELEVACVETVGRSEYERFKSWCDEYFYITHRKSIRGIGGVFFDYIKGDFSKLYDLTYLVSNAYVKVFPRILARRKNHEFTEEDKDGQLYWRGRYAEFNLVYDRGTKFGLMTGGHTEAIFVSLPPVVKW